MQMIVWILPDIFCAIFGLAVATLFFVFFLLFAWCRIRGKWGANRHAYHLRYGTTQCVALALIVIVSSISVM